MNENKTILRRENAIIRGLDGLTMLDMKHAAILHRQGITPKDVDPTARTKRINRAYVVLATINKLPGKQWFGISVNNPTITPEVKR